MPVFVDEATDLSAVQLGCTAELAHPRLRSWFASGDFRQRITATGLQDQSEIQWLNRTTRDQYRYPDDRDRLPPKPPASRTV